MATVKMERIIRRDWLGGNPWPWTFLGLALCLANWLAVLISGQSLNGIGMSILFAGLLLGAAGVVIRLNSSAPSFMDRLSGPARSVALLAMAVLCALIVIALTVLLALRFVDVNPIGLRLNALVILWFILAPMSAAALTICARRSVLGVSLSIAEESAAVLVVAAAACFCACRSLYNPVSPDDWDSIRLFLSVLFVVALGAAPLVLVSQSMRRFVVSSLIVLHFLGIATAALCPMPSPWLIQQVWSRIYQPYLEFMYLNNAYHFYSPQPGPASYLWFRMYYDDGSGKLWAHWLKIPDLDDDGWHKNHLALEYQRMLSVTENVVPVDPTPSMYMTRPDGITVYAPWYAQRVEHSPLQILGKVGPADDHGTLRVPFEPTIPFQLQYLQPNSSSRTLLSSYAKHICREKHPTHPDWKINSVRIYRVVHAIPESGPFIAERMDPRDPSNYRPYYMGHYDPDGKLLDISQFDSSGNLLKAGDPFLFWLLPMLRDPPVNQLKSPIKAWALKHAGDPDWVYTYDEKEKRHVRALTPGQDDPDDARVR